MMTSQGCFAALAFEISCRKAAGLATPWQARELLAVDIEDAADQGDVERLEVLWREIPMLVGEAAELVAAGVELPI